MPEQHSRENRQQFIAFWSSTTNRYANPWLRTKFGERAFSHAGPAAWNSLPANIRAESSQTYFKKMLKTHVFSLAYSC